MIGKIHLFSSTLIGACLVAVLLHGCGHPRLKSQSVKTEVQDLQHWLTHIDQGTLADWQGWSPAWQLDDLQQLVQPSHSALPYQLGSQSLLRHWFQLPNQPQPLQVLADTQGEVVLVRLEDAILSQSAQALADQWGKPDLKKELPSDHRFAPAQLWVFAARGISLYVLDAHTQGPRCLSAIALYVPTTSAHFLSTLEGDERIRMWDER
jgi:hypothetical protein